MGPITISAFAVIGHEQRRSAESRGIFRGCAGMHGWHPSAYHGQSDKIVEGPGLLVQELLRFSEIVLRGDHPVILEELVHDVHIGNQELRHHAF